jgi:hypothetical protein
LGHLQSYRSINGDPLVALDGTRYRSSPTIHCNNCSATHHKNGTATHSHSVVTPVSMATGNPRALPLEAVFITPQDGHEKQDCENAAAKRWLSEYGARYRALGVTILVNWCELTTTRDDGKVVYKNAFATHHRISAANVADIVRDGRTLEGGERKQQHPENQRLPPDPQLRTR